MDLEGLADAELVDEGRHELRVGFERDESRASLGDIGICECRHGGLVRYGCCGRRNDLRQIKWRQQV